MTAAGAERDKCLRQALKRFRVTGRAHKRAEQALQKELELFGWKEAEELSDAADEGRRLSSTEKLAVEVWRILDGLSW